MWFEFINFNSLENHSSRPPAILLISLYSPSPPHLFFHPPQTQLTAADASSINVLEGHTNCIWSLSTPPTSQPLLASCSADATIKIWDTRIHSRSPLRASFTYPGDQKVVPTCVSWDWEGRGVVIGWESGGVEMWDVERGVASVKMLLSSDGMVP